MGKEAWSGFWQMHKTSGPAGSKLITTIVHFVIPVDQTAAY